MDSPAARIMNLGGDEMKQAKAKLEELVLGGSWDVFFGTTWGFQMFSKMS